MYTEVESEDGHKFMLHPEFSIALERYAEESANATASALDELGISPDVASRLPAGALLELGGLAMLRKLQADFGQECLAELPSFTDAKEAFISQLEGKCAVGDSADQDSLSLAVMKFWMNRRAWVHSLAHPTSMLIANDDTFIDQIAEVLWRARK